MHRLNRILFVVLLVAVTALGAGPLIAELQEGYAGYNWTDFYLPFFWVSFSSLVLWCIIFVRKHPTAVRLALSLI